MKGSNLKAPFIYVHHTNHILYTMYNSLRAKSKHTIDVPRGTITRERLCYMAATLKEKH